MTSNFESKEHPHLMEYTIILLRYKWLIVLTIILIVSAVVVVSCNITPIYKATARILLARPESKVTVFEKSLDPLSSLTEYFNTQKRIIKSEYIARKVINKLKLQQLPRYSGISNLEAVFIRQIEVEGVQGSDLIDISVYEQDPVLAARLANLVVDYYIKDNLEKKEKNSREAISWLKEELTKEEKKSVEAYMQLHNYKKKHNIVSIEGRQNTVTAKLQSFNDLYIKAKANRLECEADYKESIQYKDITDLDINSLPKILVNRTIESLILRKQNLLETIDEYSKTYKSKHPKYLKVKTQLDTVIKDIKNEISNLINGLKSDYERSVKIENNLFIEVKKQKDEAIKLSELAIEYDQLERKAKSSEAMYNSLLTRMKEIDITSGLKIAHVKLIDKAVEPLKPVSPDITKNIIVSFVFSLVVGITFSLLLAYLDRTAKTPEDLTLKLDLEFLGLVPSIRKKKERLISKNEVGSVVLESFRTIRTNLQFFLSRDKCNKLLITSSNAAEGKTFCVANLAVAFALIKYRVILIDADMRKPRIYKIFSISKEHPGLSSILEGKATLNEVVIKHELPGDARLDILTVGHIPDNPNELLGSVAMTGYLNQIESQYDIILLDSSPIAIFSDSLILSKFTDGIIYILKAHKSRLDMAGANLVSLKEKGINIVGGILNNVKVTRHSYYYDYYSSYYYRDRR